MRTNASGQGGGALFGIPKPGRARFGTLLLPRDSREAGATSLSIFSFFYQKYDSGWIIVGVATAGTTRLAYRVRVHAAVGKSGKAFVAALSRLHP
jgi:hypothetical protein